MTKAGSLEQGAGSREGFRVQANQAFRHIGKLLVTGVPGWLTSAFLEDLARDPLPGLTGIRCLTQPDTSSDPCSVLRAPCSLLDTEIVHGDLRDADSLRAAVQGIDSILHAAGVVHVRRVRDWYDVNTNGTRALALAAVQAGVGRMVYLSSNAAAGPARDFDRVLTEADPPAPRSHYGRSKWLAEQALALMSPQIETVVLRPCMFYGPPVPPRHIEVYQRIVHGRMPLVGGGHFARSLSHIDNLVQGCRLALSHPAAAGETYYITDRPVYTTRQIIEAMAAALGVRPRYLHLPRLVGPMAHAADHALAAFDCYWQTLHLVGESDWHVGVSCDKACRELGYQPSMTLADGMRQAVDWCIQERRLARKAA
jgi:nucleoside-diphosphate-sugar epimerase